MRAFRLTAVALALVALTLVAPLTQLQAQTATPAFCPGASRPGVAFATERKTVSSTAVTLTTATFEPGTDRALFARYAVLSTETDAIRFLMVSGSTPTASIGHLAPTGSYITICGLTSIENFKMIRVTTDAAVQATYFR